MKGTRRLRWAVMPFALLAAGWAGAAPDGTDEHGRARAELKNTKGEAIGTASLVGTPNGVLITLELDKGPAGVHAFHIHEKGACDAPSFESAGGHFNPDQSRHGYHDPQGPHAGDLPNLHVPPDGRLVTEVLADGVSLTPGRGSLLDADGSALLLHFGTDDYRTDPAGGAGDRVACGVIMR